MDENLEYDFNADYDFCGFRFDDDLLGLSGVDDKKEGFEINNKTIIFYFLFIIFITIINHE